MGHRGASLSSYIRKVGTAGEPYRWGLTVTCGAVVQDPSDVTDEKEENWYLQIEVPNEVNNEEDSVA